MIGVGFRNPRVRQSQEEFENGKVTVVRRELQKLRVLSNKGKLTRDEQLSKSEENERKGEENEMEET